MAEPLATAVTVIELLGKQRKLFDLAASSLLFALILASLSLIDDRTKNPLPDLNPLVVAEHGLQLLGMTDAGWLRAYADWLHRPELAPFLPCVAVVAGITALYGSMSSIYATWLLMIASATGTGWLTTLTTTAWSAVIGLAILVIIAWADRKTGGAKRLLPPGDIISTSLLGILPGLLIAPVAPVLWAMERILERYTPKAAKIKEDTPVSFKRPLLTYSDRRSNVQGKNRPAAVRSARKTEPKIWLPPTDPGLDGRPDHSATTVAKFTPWVPPADKTPAG